MTGPRYTPDERAAMLPDDIRRALADYAAHRPGATWEGLVDMIIAAIEAARGEVTP